MFVESRDKIIPIQYYKNIGQMFSRNGLGLGINIYFYVKFCFPIIFGSRLLRDLTLTNQIEAEYDVNAALIYLQNL